MLKELLVVFIGSWSALAAPARYPIEWSKEGISFPQIENKKIKDVIYAKHTVYYKIPRAYQQYNPPSLVEHRHAESGRVTYTKDEGKWSIYYSTFEPDFNGNHAFPWEGTFGLNHAVKEDQLEKRYGSINFMHLPLEAGKVVPIALLNERPIKWIFPVGTIVGEILWVKDESGKKWIFEIRCREKQPGSAAWDPIILRPIRNRLELLLAIGFPRDWTPTMTWFSLRNTHEDEVAKLEGFVERLPKLEPATVRRLLQRPFVDVTYEPWSEKSSAPTSDQEFSIVPKDYSLGLVTPDEVSCSNCHRQTQTSLWNLIPREPLIYENPEKVANIRGSDGVFSWHPFDEESIGDGKKTPRTPTARAYDYDKGLVKVIRPGDPVDNERYRLTRYVQRALKAYELPSDKRFLH